VRFTNKWRRMVVAGSLVLGLLALILVGTAPAQAQLGGQFFSLGGQATAQIISQGARYNNFLYLASPTTVFIGGNHDPGTPPWPVVNLGVIPAGQELIFRLDVYEPLWGPPPGTLLGSYYTGPASRNPDGIEHAVVTWLGPGTAKIGFEDKRGGGDRDYDDVVFIVNSAHAPEPSSLMLLGLGTVGSAGILLRRRRRTA
jgi:hypothetical protein